MLVNMALKTWVFTKADNYGNFPYAKPANCDLVNLGPNGEKSVVADPGCDPDFEAKQRQAEADNRTSQKQRDAAQAIAMILVGSPVFYFHWKWARKEA